MAFENINPQQTKLIYWGVSLPTSFLCSAALGNLCPATNAISFGIGVVASGLFVAVNTPHILKTLDNHDGVSNKKAGKYFRENIAMCATIATLTNFVAAYQHKFMPVVSNIVENVSSLANITFAP